MDFFDDYRILIYIVVLVIIGGVLYFAFVHSTVQETYKLTVICEETDRFNLTITDSLGNIKFTGQIIQPFMILLEGGNYHLETWYYDNGTKIGYQADFNLSEDRIIRVLI